MSREFFIKDTDYATEDTAGVVKVGEGLSIDADGILKVVGEGGTNYQDLVDLVVPKIELSGLKYPTILDDNNYTITLTCGDKVIKKKTKGEDTMKIDAPKLGTWTATCIPDRQTTYTATVDVAALGNAYSMSMNMNVKDLIVKTLTNLTYTAMNLASTTIGNYALFGGGKAATSSLGFEAVDAYTSDLVKKSAASLNKRRHGLSATTVGNYALFGGGIGNSIYSTVDAYTSDLVKTTAPDLSNTKRELASTTVGNYALFGGGLIGSTYYTTVDAYTSDLVKTTAPDLSVGRGGLVATTLGDYALFGGGSKGSNTYSNNVDGYTSNLIKKIDDSFSYERAYLAATTIGNYALFGGGYNYKDGVESVVCALCPIDLLPPVEE